MSIISSFEELFGSIYSHYESFSELSCKAVCDRLPDENSLLDFISTIPTADVFKITIVDQANDKLVIKNSATWLDDYREFCEERKNDISFQVSVLVEKNLLDNKGINIYSGQYIIEFFKSKTTAELVSLFSHLFSDERQFLRFNSLDGLISIHCEHIAFCGRNEIWPVGDLQRNEYLKKCDDAAVFLDFHTIRLIPQDFHVIESNSVAQDIIQVFHRIEAILAYAFVSSSAYVKKDSLVFQIELGRAYEIKLEEVDHNSRIRDIYYWALQSGNALERLAIARNVIKTYCRNADEIQSIDYSIFNSIKSNYNIFQRDTTEKYIELKEKITDFILGMTNQMQDLLHSLIDGIRNNFVAVVTFVITVLLTNSFSGEELLANGLPDNLEFVSYIFIAATLVYWIATLYTTYVKWKLLLQGYNNIKLNYEEVLDSKDIEEAFHQDKAIKDMWKKLTMYMIVISIIWVAFIVTMFVLVWIFSNKYSIINLQNEMQYYVFILNCMVRMC